MRFSCITSRYEPILVPRSPKEWGKTTFGIAILSLLSFLICELHLRIIKCWNINHQSHLVIHSYVNLDKSHLNVRCHYMWLWWVFTSLGGHFESIHGTQTAIKIHYNALWQIKTFLESACTQVWQFSAPLLKNF